MPTGFTEVSAAHLQDATGTPITNATITFTPVANNGVPLAFRTGGSEGQAVAAPVSTQVTNGVFQIQLADTALTAPVNVGYRVVVTDNVSGKILLANGYSCVQPTGPTWSFDTYQPNLAGQITIQSGPSGESAYQLWLDAGNTGTVAQFLASLIGANAYQEWLSLGNSGTVAQFVASLQGTPGSAASFETRQIRVQQTQGIMGTGQTTSIFFAAGPGSVERIQLAYSANPSGSIHNACEGSTISINVDGRIYTSSFGAFFQNIGLGDGVVAVTDFVNTTGIGHSGYAASSTDYWGGYRRIYIPFEEFCQIRITNTSGDSAAFYPNIEWYPGTPPAGLHPATRRTFGLSTLEYPASSVAPYAVTDLLPTVTSPGGGELGSVFLALILPDGNNFASLEGNPSVNLDGQTGNQTAGGTEDWFGGQFYHWPQQRTDEYGVIRNGPGSAGNFYLGLYRYFRQTPVRFAGSLQVQWPNGEQGQGSTPETIKLASSVAYYLTAAAPVPMPANCPLVMEYAAGSLAGSLTNGATVATIPESSNTVDSSGNALALKTFHNNNQPIFIASNAAAGGYPSIRFQVQVSSPYYDNSGFASDTASFPSSGDGTQRTLLVAYIPSISTQINIAKVGYNPNSGDNTCEIASNAGQVSTDPGTYKNSAAATYNVGDVLMVAVVTGTDASKTGIYINNLTQNTKQEGLGGQSGGVQNALTTGAYIATSNSAGGGSFIGDFLLMQMYDKMCSPDEVQALMGIARKKIFGSN